MSNNIKNITKALGNTITAATGVVSVSTELVADTSGLLANSIGATPAVLKALLSTPFSAAKGYLMEAENMSEEQATKAAFKYLQQDMAVTIDKGGESVGKLIASLFEDDDDTKTATEKKEVINQ